MTGKSVHNQHIERLWVDVYVCCAYTFYCLFDFLENEGCLDIDSDLQMFCLHYVFAPRINNCWEQFIIGWDNHPIESARNMTPNQLWIRGLLGIANDDGTIAKEVWLNEREQESYGIDYKGILPESTEGDDLIDVPDVLCPLSDEALAELRRTINPKHASDNRGVDIYLEAVDFVREHIT